MPLIAAGAASVLGAGANIYMGNKAIKAQEKALSTAMAYQQAQIAEAVKQLEAVGIPSIEAQKIVLQNPKLVGLDQYIPMDESQVQQIFADKDLVNKQKLVLQKMAEMGEQGITPEERAQRDTMLRTVAAQEQARQGQILQGAAERGALDSGSQLATQLQSSQASADRAQQESQNLQAQAYQRALAALGQEGQQAGTLRTQDFGEQQTRASAADRIAQANYENRMKTLQSNLAKRQALSDAQTNLANQQEQYNKGLIQQDYQNRLNKASAIANAKLGGVSSTVNMMQQQGINKANQYKGIGQGVSQGLAGAAQLYGAYDANQQKKEEARQARGDFSGGEFE